jgi:hypothetical protein
MLALMLAGAVWGRDRTPRRRDHSIGMERVIEQSLHQLNKWALYFQILKGVKH